MDGMRVGKVDDMVLAVGAKHWRLSLTRVIRSIRSRHLCVTALRHLPEDGVDVDIVIIGALQVGKRWHTYVSVSSCHGGTSTS
jgi:hypothetical protein